MQCTHQTKGLNEIRREVPPPRSSTNRAMEEFAQVAQRILQSVNAVFDKDNLLDEFDIVPQESQANRSPVIHTDHKLALESWCVPFLYAHSFGYFIEIRPRRGLQMKNPFMSQAADNGFATSSKTSAFNSSKLSEEEKRTLTLELSRILVLLNPDLAVAWNFRRETFETGYLNLKEELRLISLCLTRKPKCSEAFYYRRWLIQQAITNSTIRMDQSLEFFESEIDTATNAARKYLSNYHAWNYRLYMLDTWMNYKDVPVELQLNILKNEKCASDTWLKSHVSDYCGFHYRQRLFVYYVYRRAAEENSRQLFQNELDENRSMILYYPGHETLWYHRRIIMKQFTDSLTLGKVENLKWLHDSECDFVQSTSGNKEEISVAGSTNKGRESYISEDCSQLNSLYSQRYIKWLKMCLNWKFDA